MAVKLEEQYVLELEDVERCCLFFTDFCYLKTEKV